ncbi:MAG: 3-oxoadipate enol-lactonase [Desulfobacterales bacterium]|nr:MAG: 3-oxoadipate enol-lactonase [Desulfobacterales bacterium]
MPFIDVDGTAINCRFHGPEQGPVVMLSNSLASDLSMWKLQIPVLIDAGFRVLRYDSRGHGKSAVSQGPYTMDLLTTDAVKIIDTLGLDKILFCGLSKGGMVGQMLGTKYADRLLALVLCSTSAYIGPREIWDERIASVQKSGMVTVVDATIDRWFTKPGQARLPQEVDKVRQAILNTPVDGFCACSAAIRDMDQRESIRAISTPTKVIVGEHDPGTPVSAAELIHGQIAGSELQIISDAAHFVQIEQAAVFNQALLEFLEKSAA